MYCKLTLVLSDPVHGIKILNTLNGAHGVFPTVSFNSTCKYELSSSFFNRLDSNPIFSTVYPKWRLRI